MHDHPSCLVLIPSITPALTLGSTPSKRGPSAQGIVIAQRETGSLYLVYIGNLSADKVIDGGLSDEGSA